MRGGWTYIMTNHVRGALYIGVTANLAARVASIALVKGRRIAGSTI